MKVNATGLQATPTQDAFDALKARRSCLCSQTTTSRQATEWIHWNGDPLKPHQMYYWLWRDGCFLRSVKLRSELRPGEWLAPRFALAHYAMVTATKGGHWTVIDGDGTLLDPFDASRDSMEVYGAVHEIVGVLRR